MSTNVEGDFIRFSYLSDEGAFAVGRVMGEDGEFIVVGPIAHLLPGQGLQRSWCASLVPCILPQVREVFYCGI